MCFRCIWIASCCPVLQPNHPSRNRDQFQEFKTLMMFCRRAPHASTVQLQCMVSTHLGYVGRTETIIACFPMQDRHGVPVHCRCRQGCVLVLLHWCPICCKGCLFAIPSHHLSLCLDSVSLVLGYHRIPTISHKVSTIGPSQDGSKVSGKCNLTE